MDDVDGELRNLLDYFAGLALQDNFTEKLDEAVAEAKAHRKWRREYMRLGLMKADNRREGQIMKLTEMVCRKLIKGKSEEEIAEELDEDLSKVRRICEALAEYKPDYDYDIEKILDEVMAYM